MKNITIFISALFTLYFISCRKDNTATVVGELVSYPDSLPLEGYEIQLIEGIIYLGYFLPHGGAIQKTITDVNGKFSLEYKHSKKESRSYEVNVSFKRVNNGNLYVDTLPYIGGNTREKLEKINSKVILTFARAAYLTFEFKKVNLNIDSVYIKAHLANVQNPYSATAISLSSQYTDRECILFPGTNIIEVSKYYYNNLKSFNTDTIFLAHGEKKEYTVEW